MFIYTKSFEMPGGGRKRSITPNSSEQKRKSKRVRKDSETSRAEKTSKTHVEDCETRAANLTLKR